MSYKLGIDTGGTFTDFVLLNETTGELTFGKTPTTPARPIESVLTGTTDLLGYAGIRLSDLSLIVHGTALISTAINERRGARVGLITTRGFEDVLEIGREFRYDAYDLQLTVPPPIVPRHLRLGVVERLDYRGNILTPLDESDALRLLHTLVDEGVEAIGVCLLHSFINPVHERALGALIQQQYPHLFVSLSADVLPEIREYERTSATTINAYVQPLADDYLKTFRRELEQRGFAGTLQMMTAGGRLTTFEAACRMPVQLIESGPAGGAMTGVFLAKLTGHTDLITFDMGGTAAHASLIDDQQPEQTKALELARVRPFRRGSGLPVPIAAIGRAELGAGGCRIAHVTAAGLLAVGPDSADADRGPACYGRGGTLPTVTDCDLVLGYLEEGSFMGGMIPLDREAARRAIDEQLAKPLRISVEEAAMSVYRMVNETMANAIRMHGSAKDQDLQQRSLLAFGGVGPVHAFEVARLLNSPELIIPVGAGVSSALGLLVAPTASQHSRTDICPLAGLDWTHVNDLLAELEEEGMRVLEEAGLDTGAATVSRVVDMRYMGQSYELPVRLSNGILSGVSMPEMAAHFAEAYRQRFGRAIDEAVVEVVEWRVDVTIPPVLFNPRQAEPRHKQIVGSRDFSGLKGYRQVYYAGDSIPCACPVYDRDQIRPNDSLSGPVIIEEMGSTVVVGHKAYVRMDEHRNLVISLRR